MHRLLLALLVIAVCGAPVTQAGERSRPNIVVILCDDLGYGDLSCYSHPHIRTPRLDRLARDGLRFTDGYAAAPVCSPARAGMLTGRTPHRAGIYDWIPDGSPMHLRRNEITVATLLKRAGYATSFAGKWHCNGKFNLPAQPQPTDHGFDHWFATQNNAIPSHHNPVNFVRNGTPVGPLEGYSSTLIVNEAIDWLGKRDESKPFCLFVWFHSPHEPIATDPAFAKLYADLEPAERRDHHGNVTQMDHEVGRLLDTLDDMKLRDDTFVLFTSDNGPETLDRYPRANRSYGSPGKLRGMKLHMYEGGIRVPLIIRWPGHIRPGTATREPVCGTDVLPTLCAMAGVDLPADLKLDGANILPALDGKPVDRKRPLYWRYDQALGGPKVAMRVGAWKVLADEKLKHLELYNLSIDPSEKHDLARSEPERLTEMAATLRTIHADVAEGAPTWPPWQRSPRKRHH